MKKLPPVLVILTPGFPEDENDTSCLPFAQSLVKAINKNYVSVEVIILSFQYPFEAGEYNWHGNKVYAFGGRNKGKLSRRLLWYRVRKKLNQINNNKKIIGLFSLWLGECALIGNSFGIKNGIAHRCWIAGQDAKENNKFVHKIDAGPEELVAISDFVADEFFKNYLVRPQHIIPNGIEKELFQQKLLERTIDVLGAGSLIPLKQYHLFINCIEELRKSLPNIYAMIAGKGPEEFLLHKNVIERRLQNNLVLNGELAHTHLLKLMQQTKVFLHPSSYEGFSMVCLEALYAGCHVISFCKPMKQNFDHWHIVKTEEEMIIKSRKILTQFDLENKSVMPYSINQTAMSIMKLYKHE